MALEYQWRATTTFGGTVDPNTLLTHGVTPNTSEDWQTATIGTQGSGSWEYWFHDANVMVGGYYTDANASRVVFPLSQTWNTSVDSHNNLTVTIETVLGSVVRDNVVGQNQDTPGRQLDFYKRGESTAFLSLTDTNLTSAHTIYAGPLSLGTFSFTLAPGEGLHESSIYIHNNTIGRPYFDDVRVGVEFKNILPADYRPGAALDTNTSIWKSHNRSNGACYILSNVNNMTWHECRTSGGDVGGQGNPPLILHAANANSWYNQKLLGKMS